MTVWCRLACDHCGHVFEMFPQVAFFRQGQKLLREEAAKQGWVTRRRGRVVDDFCCKDHARRAKEDESL